MKNKKQTYSQLETKLAEAEKIIEALEQGQADAIVSKKRIQLLRFKEAEEALRESEERYRSFIETNPSAVFYLDPTGKITETNPAAVRLFGYKTDELLEKKWQDLCIPEDMDRTMKHFKACLSGEILEIHTAIISKDNHRVDVYLAGGPLIARGEIQGLFIIAHNLTKLKKVEEELRTYQAELEQQNEELRLTETELTETRDRYQELYEFAPVGYLTLDREGTIRQANLVTTMLCGKDRKDIIGKRIERLMVPEDRDACYIYFRDIAANRAKKSCELRFMGPDNSVVWVQMETMPTGEPHRVDEDAYRVTVTDITARKQIQQQLEIQEERLRLAVEAGELGLWDHDFRTGETFFSDTLFDLLGADRKERTTINSLLKYLHEEDRSQVLRHAEQWLASGAEFEDEFRIVREDGQIRWHAAVGHLFCDDEGWPLRSAGVIFDITERKRTEEKLRRLNETLEQRIDEQTTALRQQADQLRALTNKLSQAEQQERKRLAQILHDHVQQLIVAARNKLEPIKRIEPEHVKGAVKEVDDILHEVLETSRSLTIDLSPPVLHESGLISALNWLVSRMQEKNQFTVNLHADIKAEPDNEEIRFLLFECVRELLLNAMKHANVQEADVTLVRMQKNRIKLTVSDKGNGFDPDLIWNRTPKDATFGLFNTQQRLSYIGGRMEIETAPGKGTTVALAVPAGEAVPSEEGAPEADQVPEKEKTIRIHQKSAMCRVLIVDDHKIMREGLVALFRFEPDIEVVGEAADGPEGIELAKELNPDVVIMDVNLGEMSGVEATRRILAANPHIRVIGLSMHIDKDIESLMYNAGATDYLIKGGPAKDLIAAVRKCHGE